MARYKELPDLNLLNYMFEYNKETGEIRRKVALSNKVRVGDLVGTNNCGYLYVSINYRMYAVHRICYIMGGGILTSELQIDHLNHLRSDNRFCNLRAVNDTNNATNQKIRSNNKSGYIGVCWNQLNQKWRARINYMGKQIEVGSFDDLESAYIARNKKADDLGFLFEGGKIE